MEDLTLKDLSNIIDDVRAMNEADVRIEVTSVDKRKGVGAYYGAMNRMPIHACLLVAYTLKSRDDLPDPPEAETLGDLIDFFADLDVEGAA